MSPQPGAEYIFVIYANAILILSLQSSMMDLVSIVVSLEVDVAARAGGAPT